MRYLQLNHPDFLVSLRSFDLGRFLDDTQYSLRHFDIDETESQYVLTLELPGFKSSEVDVSLDKDLLTVHAKRADRSYESSATIPAHVDADKIEAKLESGILSIVLPKSELAKPRKISVK